jgi:two-component system KDP operon response regulator KdpE
VPEANVLVASADRAVGPALVRALEACDYLVRTEHTGQAVLDGPPLAEIDVVLLDLDLPDLLGPDICRHVRLRTLVPIVVLSADGAEDRKVAALDMGADDYLTKPFSMPELLARVRVALRHRRLLGALVDDELVQVGLLRLDLSSHEAMVVDRPLDLTPKEFALSGSGARHPAHPRQPTATQARGARRCAPPADRSRRRLSPRRRAGRRRRRDHVGPNLTDPHPLDDRGGSFGPLRTDACQHRVRFWTSDAHHALMENPCVGAPSPRIDGVGRRIGL